MKKILLILFISWQFNGFAQINYTPFPNERVYHMMKYKEGMDIPTTTTRYYKAVLGDTIINNIRYMKYYDPVLKSGLRNDTLNKKVYCYDFATAKDTVLYNFNLKINDTVFRKGNYKIWVESIDSVLLLDNIYYKRYNFNKLKPTGMIPPPFSYSSLVEGLGYQNGNKFSNEYEQHIVVSYILVCASANKKIQVSIHGLPPNGEYCGAIITNTEKSVNKEILALYPNPTTGTFQLKAENVKIHTIEITNVLGSVIYTGSQNQGTTEVDLSRQPAGIYFVRLYAQEGKSLTRKIIKQ